MTLLCALLILARVGGAHWHLCTDQPDPILTVQGAVDPACETSSDHHDVDLETTKSALAKTFNGTSFDLLLIAALVCAWILAATRLTGSLPPYIAPIIDGASLFPHAAPRAPPL